MRIDTDHDDIRQARVRLVRALKQQHELMPIEAIDVIGLGTRSFSGAVLREFVKAGNVHLIIENEQRGGRPKKRIRLRKAS